MKLLVHPQELDRTIIDEIAQCGADKIGIHPGGRRNSGQVACGYAGPAANRCGEKPYRLCESACYFGADYRELYGAPDFSAIKNFAKSSGRKS